MMSYLRWGPYGSSAKKFLLRRQLLPNIGKLYIKKLRNGHPDAMAGLIFAQSAPVKSCSPDLSSKPFFAKVANGDEIV